MTAAHLRALTDDYEIIVIENGSTDYTVEVLEALAPQVDHLRVLTHRQPLGYGGALRKGFAAATKELIFYTDSDGQYDPRELPLLVAALTPDVDIVNGYKISRSDPLGRIIIGKVYHYTMKLLFGFTIRDVDCDFRLIRREVFKKVHLDSYSGSICVEFITKAQDLGFHFAEVPVHHYHRAHGKSQFFNFPRIWQTVRQLSGLWWTLRVKRAHLKAPAPAPLPLERRRMIEQQPSYWRGVRTLVTGGLGFIGSNLVHRLHALGARVMVVDALIPGHGGDRANLDGLELRCRGDRRRPARPAADGESRRHAGGHLQSRRPDQP